MVRKDLFKYGQRYTLDEVAEVAGDEGLLVVAHYDNDYPRLDVVADNKEGDTAFQFTPVSDDYCALTWTQWD